MSGIGAEVLLQTLRFIQDSKMRIFHPGTMQKIPKEWAYKVNFADENNVVLGYDSEQNCCEVWSWNIDRGSGVRTILTNDNYHIDPAFVEENYVFDPTFFDEVRFSDTDDVGTAAIFKLVNKNDPNDVYYVNLWNVHNGYYSHGFAFSKNEKVIKEGRL